MSTPKSVIFALSSGIKHHGLSCWELTGMDQGQLPEKSFVLEPESHPKKHYY